MTINIKPFKTLPSNVISDYIVNIRTGEMEFSFLCLVICGELLTYIHVILANKESLFIVISGVSQITNEARKEYNITATECGVECLKENCRGFNVHKISESSGLCELNTASKAQEQFTITEDRRYFCEYQINYYLYL